MFLHKFYIGFLLNFLQFYTVTSYLTETQTEKSETERGTFCQPTPPSFEIRAILIPYDVKYCPFSNTDSSTTKFADFSSKTKNRNKDKNKNKNKNEKNHKISDGTKKLIVTLKITNMGITNCKNQYVVLDHVYDYASEQKQKLLYPYVLKIKQKTIMQTYKLTRVTSVNSRASERVKNKHNDPDYKGCKVTGDDTTCPQIMYEDHSVPFSTGFCCSCEDQIEKVNEVQKLLKDVLKTEKRELRDNLTMFNFDGITEEVSTKSGFGDLKYNLEELLRKPVDDHKNNSSFFHPRGGQDCLNKTTPPGLNPEKFHQSTHCLSFSKLWYTVYKLENPTISHELSMEIFEKHLDKEGQTAWRDLTEGKPIILSTLKREELNDSILAQYNFQQPPNNAFGIDPNVQRLLVPEPIEDDCLDLDDYPEIKAGPKEWLVVPASLISSDGSKCDKVGVGYEAFAKQPNKCEKPQGTCLGNQPFDLWLHDSSLENQGRMGSYFLKNFGFLPPKPILKENQNLNLTMEFRGVLFSMIHFELKTDYNLIINEHSSAVITEVYTDSTNYIKSKLTVKITNNGLMVGTFYAALINCPHEIPASFNNIRTKPAIIPPQTQHTFVVEIMTELPQKKFFCTVEARNIKSEILAIRKVRFQKNDRCICIFHCSCTCLIADGSLKCKPLKFDSYNAAGFHGGLPMPTNLVKLTLFEELMTTLYHLFITMTTVLLILGISKGIAGIFNINIGEWGLFLLLGLPKPMKNYQEKSLKEFKVKYDREGFPVHPETGKRVRNAPFLIEFLLNVVFFFIYPLVMMNLVVRRMCFVDKHEVCCLCGKKHAVGHCSSFGIHKSNEEIVRKKKKYKTCPAFAKNDRELLDLFSRSCSSSEHTTSTSRVSRKTQTRCDCTDFR